MLTDFMMVSLLQFFREIKSIQIIGVLFCSSDRLVYEILAVFQVPEERSFPLFFSWSTESVPVMDTSLCYENRLQVDASAG